MAKTFIRKFHHIVMSPAKKKEKKPNKQNEKKKI